MPTLHSATVASVFEGWAESLGEALALVRSGRIEFIPAQDLGVATPMAAVVSPSMQLIEIRDGAGRACAYAPINGAGSGGGPGARYRRLTAGADARARQRRTDRMASRYRPPARQR